MQNSKCTPPTTSRQFAWIAARHARSQTHDWRAICLGHPSHTPTLTTKNQWMGNIKQLSPPAQRPPLAAYEAAASSNSPLGVVRLEEVQVRLPLVPDDLSACEASHGDDHGVWVLCVWRLYEGKRASFCVLMEEAVGGARRRGSRRWCGRRRADADGALERRRRARLGRQGGDVMCCGLISRGQGTVGDIKATCILILILVSTQVVDRLSRTSIETRDSRTSHALLALDHFHYFLMRRPLPRRRRYPPKLSTTQRNRDIKSSSSSSSK